MNRRYIILREEMEDLYRRHFAKKEEECVRPGGKEPFQQPIEDAAWYFQMDKKRLRRLAENDVDCRFGYYDGTTYWIVIGEFEKIPAGDGERCMLLSDSIDIARNSSSLHL